MLPKSSCRCNVQVIYRYKNPTWPHRLCIQKYFITCSHPPYCKNKKHQRQCCCLLQVRPISLLSTTSNINLLSSEDNKAFPLKWMCKCCTVAFSPPLLFQDQNAISKVTVWPLILNWCSTLSNTHLLQHPLSTDDLYSQAQNEKWCLLCRDFSSLKHVANAALWGAIRERLKSTLCHPSTKVLDCFVRRAKTRYTSISCKTAQTPPAPT